MIAVGTSTPYPSTRHTAGVAECPATSKAYPTAIAAPASIQAIIGSVQSGNDDARCRACVRRDRGGRGGVGHPLRVVHDERIPVLTAAECDARDPGARLPLPDQRGVAI